MKDGDGRNDYNEDRVTLTETVTMALTVMTLTVIVTRMVKTMNHDVGDGYDDRKKGSW